MQIHISSGAVRVLAACAALGALLTGCSNANDPYARLADPPLVQGRLHTITLASADASLAQQVLKAGYQYRNLPPNYPEADAVQGVLWNVSPAVAKDAKVYGAPGSGPNLRLLVQPLPPAAPPADAGIERSFFRNVLGTDVPRWPDDVARDDRARVLVWTYQVPSIVEARRKLRANAIPVVTEPVGITTPYLGDEKSMSLRAPDGAIVELVEAVAQ
jgi:hypothetical protein